MLTSNGWGTSASKAILVVLVRRRAAAARIHPDWRRRQCTGDASAKSIAKVAMDAGWRSVVLDVAEWLWIFAVVELVRTRDSWYRTWRQNAVGRTEGPKDCERAVVVDAEVNKEGATSGER